MPGRAAGAAEEGIMKKAVRHAIRHSRAAFAWGRYNNLHKKYSSKGTAPKVSKGRSESPLGSEAFIASGDKEKAERVSRNEQPLAATIEAADAPAGAKHLPLAKKLF